jgi:sugar O-acyltransferase (sialic acid O-acetyltransferase NeuD family)
VFDALSVGDSYEVACFVDRDPPPNATLYGVPLVREDDFLSETGPSNVVLAIGDNWIRQRIAQHVVAKRPSVEFIRAIHPRAIVSPLAIIGPGCVVLAGAVVGAETVLRNHVSIWSNAVIEHDCIAEDFVTLAPSATTGGSVNLGTRAFLGLACAVRHGLTIGSDCVVGANSAVVRDIEECAIMVGSPAQQIGVRRPGDPYL